MINSAAIKRAADYLDATDMGDGQWAYYDEGMRRYYLVSADDLAGLCEFLDATDTDISRDAYSHWCAGTTAWEMPFGWTPDTVTEHERASA